uniref:Uncharacterized protein n=1 Tax=Ulva partita TaxID=1605170 RepID=A0A1C9ZPN5_9CHLO|nr:hypothetical protein [Ulva partita]
MVARLVDVALHSSLCSTLCPVREPAGNLFTLHMLRAPKASANFCTQSRQHYITYIPSSRKSCKWLSTPLKKSEARTANCKPAINVHAPAVICFKLAPALKLRLNGKTCHQAIRSSQQTLGSIVLMVKIATSAVMGPVPRGREAPLCCHALSRHRRTLQYDSLTTDSSNERYS